MKKTLLLLLLVLIPILSVSPQDIWESLGPEGGSVKKILQDPGDSNTLYTVGQASPCKIYKSTDNGTTWQESGCIGRYTYDVAISSVSPAVLYAGCSTSFYKSTDGGVTWIRVFNNSDFQFYDEIATDPFDGNTVYAAGRHYTGTAYESALLISTNSGADWTYKYLGTLVYSQVIAIDPTNADIIYIGGYDTDYNPTAFKTTDGGDTWTDISSHFDSYVMAIAIAPSDPSRIYIATSYDVFRSSDNGATWTKQASGQYVYTNQLAVDPLNADIVYSGYYRRVQKSTDGGVHWTHLYSGLEQTNACSSLLISSASVNTLYFSSTTGFFVSTNAGVSWNIRCAGLILTNITALSLAPTDNDQLIIGVYNDGVYKTSDAVGKVLAPADVTWSRLPDFYSCHNVSYFLISPEDPDIIYAMEGGG